MKATRAISAVPWVVAAAAALARCLASEPPVGVVAVFSRACKDYVRVRLSDGTPSPETYVFGEGGHWNGGPSDATLDAIPFMELAQMMAQPLAEQHYIPSADLDSTKLLILVYWGSTPVRAGDSVASQNLQDAASVLAAGKSSAHQEEVAELSEAPKGGSSSALIRQNSNMSAQIATAAGLADADNAMSGAMAMASAENRSRDQLDSQVAAMLGYDALWNDTARYIGTPLDYRRQDVSAELEEGRYFVVLMAYDFRLLWKQKKRSLLWETRFSVTERRNAFDKMFPGMVEYASQFFGRDSHGLLRRQVPLGRVEIGELKALGEAEPPVR